MALVSNETTRAPSGAISSQTLQIVLFSDILEELLSENMFMLQREVASMPFVIPRWEHCLEYEFQLRKEAICLTVEENFSIQAALWHAFEDQQHKLTHWVQLLTIANAQQACSSDEISKLRKDRRGHVLLRAKAPARLLYRHLHN